MLNSFIKKIRLLTVPREEPYLLLTGLNIFPKNIKYYEVAFSHKSASATVDGKQVNNERLEYLGDAVLDAIAADILYHLYPNRKEGFLTDARSKMVQRETLNKVAESIGLQNIVVMSNKTQTHKVNVYGNAFEAMVGALFLDQGYAKCRDFFANEIIGKHLDLKTLLTEEQNYKSKLLEWAQRFRVELEFKLLDSVNEENGNTRFTTMVLINNLPAGIGTGYSKKESHQNAAQKALAKVRSNKSHFLVSNTLKKPGENNRPPRPRRNGKTAEASQGETAGAQRQTAAQEDKTGAETAEN